jgi:hypothetical protein
MGKKFSKQAIDKIEEKFKILHTTIQVEKSNVQHSHQEV